MKQVIYVSEHCGYSHLLRTGKPLMEFTSYPVIDPTKGMVKKGVLVLDAEKDAGKIKKIEALPQFKKEFIRVNKLPTRANDEGTITGVRTGHEEPANIANELKKSLGDKYQRYYELKDKTKKGKELTEFKDLEIELEIERK